MKNYNNLDQVVDGLPGLWYYDVDFYNHELSTLWSTQWLYVCHESQLSEALMYRLFKIGDYSIIVLRDKSNQLRAYHNVCRHRGSVLCIEEQGKLRNNTLLCPYHNWLFSAESGDLLRTPTLTPDNFDKTTQGLYTVQIKSFRGLIFINIDENAQWQEEKVFQDYDPILEKYPLENMRVGHIWRKEVNCNWKIYWENFSECYHCPNIHPELSQLVPIYSRRIVDMKDYPDWEQNTESTDPLLIGGLRKDGETWSTDGTAQGQFIVSPDEVKGQSYSTTWPTMFFGAYADHLRSVRILPLSPTTTELSVEWLFTDEALADEKYKTNNVTEFAKLVMEQDAWASDLNQQGIQNPRFEKGSVMAEEYTVKDFHTWLRENIKK